MINYFASAPRLGGMGEGGRRVTLQYPAIAYFVMASYERDRETETLNECEGSNFKSDAALHNLLQTMPFIKCFVTQIISFLFHYIAEFHIVALADLPDRVFC